MAAQPHVNQTWLCQGGTRRDLPMLFMVDQLSEPRSQAGYPTVSPPFQNSVSVLLAKRSK